MSPESPDYGCGSSLKVKDDLVMELTRQFPDLISIKAYGQTGLTDRSGRAIAALAQKQLAGKSSKKFLRVIDLSGIPTLSSEVLTVIRHRFVLRSS